MKISVLIPTKNEPLINELIKRIHGVLKTHKHEIIVIDKSNTRPKIRNAKLVLQKSDGLGKAILEGLKYAHGDVIVIMDGDGSHDPKFIPKFIEKIKKYDIVIGSRFTKGGKTEDPSYRKIVSATFRKITSIILGIKTKDSMSGFSAIRRDVYDAISLNPRGYKINMEILYKSKKFGFKTVEVPIVFHKRMAGKPTPKIIEGIRLLVFIIELKLGIR